MRAVRRHRVVGLLLALVASAIILPAPAAAASWTTPRLIVSRQWDTGMFAAYHEREVAIAYFNGSSTDLTSWLSVRTSGNSGGSFASPVLLAKYVTDAGATVCDGWAYVAYVTMTSDVKLIVAKVSVGGTVVQRTRVATLDSPDVGLAIACGAGRVWLATTEPASLPDTYHAVLRHALLPTLNFSAPLDLGGGVTSQRISVAAGQGFSAVAWQTGAGLRLVRSTVGAAPAYSVTTKPAIAMAPGAKGPALAADGRNLILAFVRSDHDWFRSSPDGGATFATARVLGKTGELASLALEGRRIVAVVTVKDFLEYVRYRSGDGGATWTQKALGDAEHQDGFVQTAAGYRLADSWHRFWMWGDPADIWFHREI